MEPGISGASAITLPKQKVFPHLRVKRKPKAKLLGFVGHTNPRLLEIRQINVVQRPRFWPKDFSQVHFLSIHAFDKRPSALLVQLQPVRSEERRVGKECRSRWSPYH